MKRQGGMSQAVQRLQVQRLGSKTVLECSGWSEVNETREKGCAPCSRVPCLLSSLAIPSLLKQTPEAPPECQAM